MAKPRDSPGIVWCVKTDGGRVIGPKINLGEKQLYLKCGQVSLRAAI